MISVAGNTQVAAAHGQHGVLFCRRARGFAVKRAIEAAEIGGG
jgi:hypothetical protein